jgi:Dolichyl-phosphate-mannose-protein mannosyltransferase
MLNATRSRDKTLQCGSLIASNPRVKNDQDKILRIAWWVLAAAVFSLTTAVRIRLLGIPLERDEGEYAYAGQLLLQGIPPYKLAYSMKFPGTYVAYAITMFLFGQTITAIHLGLLLVNCATSALIFFIGKRLLNSTVGIVAAASYALLSVSPSVLGLAAHATHFVVLPVLGSAFLLLNKQSRLGIGRLLLSGLLMGLGLLMKQPAFFFILFGGVYLFLGDVRAGLALRKAILRNLVFAGGAVTPLVITFLALYYAGVFAGFWFWTIHYAHEYGTLVSISDARQLLIQGVRDAIGPNWPLWILAGVGLLTCSLNRSTGRTTGFLLGLFISSILALCLGFYFRSHYFILLLPAVALFAGIAINNISSVLHRQITAARFFPLLLFASCAVFLVVAQRDLFFLLSPIEASHTIYAGNPFPETIKVAEYVREHTNPSDTIAVVGSEPQIYFYSHRHSATGYIYTYPLMEAQKYARQMQSEMFREIEGAEPKYLISVTIDVSWLHSPRSENLIFEWVQQYIAENYVAVGFINIIAEDRIEYYFDDIPQQVPELGEFILIYRRKP